jgi:hypothetical protein
MKTMRMAMLAAVLIACGVSASHAADVPFAQSPAVKELDLKKAEPKVTDEEWAKYEKTLAERADKAVADAKIEDPAKAQHVKASVTAWYKVTRAWDAQNGTRLKELRKNAKANAEEITKLRSSLKPLHDAFVADMASVLTPDQVDAIKEYLTYKRPSIMYTGFTKDNPWLNEAQKARIKEIANEAREAAMDEGSSDDKHKVMDQYKGRITNFIAAEKKKVTTTQPAAQ